MLRERVIKYNFFNFSTNELPELTLNRQKEKSAYTKSTTILPADLDHQGYVGQRAVQYKGFFSQRNTSDPSSIKPILSFLLAFHGHYLFPLFLSGQLVLTLEATPFRHSGSV
jgi:hypothetical protein